MQFLLLLGTAQSSWCIHDGDVNVVPDILLKNYRSVPTTCLTSSSMFVEQHDKKSPSDCSGCIDLTFEELTPTILSYKTDVKFSPEIDQLPPPILVSWGYQKTRSFNLPLKDRLRQTPNIHKSIESTILII